MHPGYNKNEYLTSLRTKGNSRGDAGEKQKEGSGNDRLVEVGHLLDPVRSDGPTKVGNDAPAPPPVLAVVVVIIGDRRRLLVVGEFLVSLRNYADVAGWGLVGTVIVAKGQAETKGHLSEAARTFEGQAEGYLLLPTDLAPGTGAFGNVAIAIAAVGIGIGNEVVDLGVVALLVRRRRRRGSLVEIVLGGTSSDTRRRSGTSTGSRIVHFGVAAQCDRSRGMDQRHVWASRRLAIGRFLLGLPGTCEHVNRGTARKIQDIDV